MDVRRAGEGESSEGGKKAATSSSEYDNEILVLKELIHAPKSLPVGWTHWSEDDLSRFEKRALDRWGKEDLVLAARLVDAEGAKNRRLHPNRGARITYLGSPSFTGRGAAAVWLHDNYSPPEPAFVQARHWRKVKIGRLHASKRRGGY